MQAKLLKLTDTLKFGLKILEHPQEGGKLKPCPAEALAAMLTTHSHFYSKDPISQLQDLSWKRCQAIQM